MLRGGFSLRQAVVVVAALNVGYFGIEVGVAAAIGSVSLLADSIDFLEDASINALIFVALAWSAARRAQVGTLLSFVILVPALATLWMVWQKIADPVPPEALALGVTGTGAMAVNFACALLLATFRHHESSLTRAAYLSARNDVLANVGIIGAGLLTAATASVWPDVAVGLAIFAINADAARQVFRAAQRERLT